MQTFDRCQVSRQAVRVLLCSRDVSPAAVYYHMIQACRVLAAEAQHVILVEPLLDPAVEAQVVGRVHRIGQTRPTTVHRFVMDASIEENVCQLSYERAATMDVAAAAAGRQALKAEQQSLSIRYGC